MTKTENDVLFELMAGGMAQVICVLAMVDIDEEERNDLITRASAITYQVADILGYKGQSFDAFVTGGQELAVKLNAKWQRMK